MAISSQPLVTPDPRVTVATTRHLASYHEASVAMYTEEVGVAPLDIQGSYRDHVASLMMKGFSMAALWDNRVVFKADVVAAAGLVCQVGGVWLAPELRGRGYSEPMMAAVVEICRQRFPVVSLYANSHNIPALRCYQAIGFQSVGEFATILY